MYKFGYNVGRKAEGTVQPIYARCLEKGVISVKKVAKVVLAALVPTCAVIALGAAWAAPAAYVGDIAVGAEELQLYMDENRAQTVAWFSSEYQLDLNEAGAWEQDCGGITPREYLVQAALEDLQYEKALLQQANENGMDLPVTGREIEDARKKENKQRSEKIAAGEVVYGPQEYGPMEYRSYLCSQAEAAVEETILQTPPSDEELRGLYEQMDPELLDMGYEAEVDYYYLPQDLPLSDAERQELLRTVAQLAGQQEPEQLLESCKAQYGVEPVHQTMQVGTDARKGEDQLQLELYAEVKEVEPQTVKTVERDGSLVAVLYVRSKEAYGSLSFEEAKDQVQDQWAEQEMESCIRTQAEKMETREGILVSWKLKY